MRLLLRSLAVLALLLPAAIAPAQTPKTYTSSEILLGLKKLNVVGSVLYIAAHPDDENTRLLAYLANERLLETGYLSCTRGDGGQNLIGPELREQLGVIRTQELLAARRLDGARQFFTRANDFGFSKTSDETFTIWDKEQVLADMVWVIRQRRPDVLITRFPPDARAGHGHHQASAILAAEAFDAAGDPKRFPEQLKYVQPWQPKRLLWNTGSFFVKSGDSMDGYLKLDAGGYNPLLGQSYGEIAARSRSNHRSQGFGSAAQRGEALEYFQPVKGDKATKDLFDGVDLSWNRVPGGAAISKQIQEVIRTYDASNPSASVAGLLKVQDAIYALKPSVKNGKSFWEEKKLIELNKLIQAALGLYVEATAANAFAVAGQPVNINLEIIKRSDIPLELIGVNGINEPRKDSVFASPILLKEPLRIQSKHWLMPDDIANTQPYWLRNPGTTGMYSIPAGIPVANNPDIPDKLLQGIGSITPGGLAQREFLGLPENPAVATISVNFKLPSYRSGFYFLVPVQYKHTDPVLGELYQPLAVVPPVLVNLPAARAYIFADGQPKQVPVTLRAGRAGVAGTLALQAPTGWQLEPATAAFNLKTKDEEQTVNFTLRPLPTAASGKFELKAEAVLAPLSAGEGPGVRLTRGIQTINYPHIPTQTLFPEATAPLVKLDVKRKGQQIGYLMGAGDEVPEALRQLGYTVTLLDPTTDLTADRLRRYDAVVLGIRAYNTLDKLKSQQPELLKYAENGGNVVVQYVVNRGTVIPQIGPYPLTLSTDRVTVEGAPVTFLAPNHPLLNTPNKITTEDFQGWIQEQGLYYPSAWDAKYTPIISSHDPGEDDKKSAILVADYGKGHYIYTGLSLFRELPAGVPGAYRILANLVSYGK